MYLEQILEEALKRLSIYHESSHKKTSSYGGYLRHLDGVELPYAVFPYRQSHP